MVCCQKLSKTLPWAELFVNTLQWVARYGASHPPTAIASVYETQLALTVIDNILGNICQIMGGEGPGDFIAVIDILEPYGFNRLIQAELFINFDLQVIQRGLPKYIS